MCNSTETLAQINQKYWDVASSNCHTAQWVTDLQSQISTFLSDPTTSTAWLGLPANSPQEKLLDYACGNGIVSVTLKPHFKTCIGIDVSAGMLAKYTASAARLGLSSDEMLGVRGDLFAEPVEPTDPPLAEDRLWGFDLVAICMALHHMQDIQHAVSKLVERLRPGGTLLVIDWAEMNGVAQGEVGKEEKQNGREDRKQQHLFVDPEQPAKPHPASHTITHESFSEEQIRGLFENAGCTEVRWKLADELSHVPGARTGKMQLFWARATKGEGK